MIQIDASLLIVFFIVWILVFALTKLFFNPLKKVIKDRQDGIERNRAASEKSMEAVKLTVLKIEGELKSAKARSQEIKENYEKKALEERERVLAKVSAEWRNEIDKAKKQLSVEAGKLRKELESQTFRLAETIEKKFLN